MLLAASMFIVSCEDNKKEEASTSTEETENAAVDNFDYTAEEVADLKILRYQIPGWENLSLKEQKLVYYLTQAGLSGRDILWDQNYKQNLTIRKAFENIYANYEGDKEAEETMVMNVPVAMVYNEVNDLKTWETWSPWKLEDPNLVINYLEKTKASGVFLEAVVTYI